MKVSLKGKAWVEQQNDDVSVEIFFSDPALSSKIFQEIYDRISSGSHMVSKTENCAGKEIKIVFKRHI